jgi:hypothetical protein
LALKYILLCPSSPPRWPNRSRAGTTNHWFITMCNFVIFVNDVVVILHWRGPREKRVDLTSFFLAGGGGGVGVIFSLSCSFLLNFLHIMINDAANFLTPARLTRRVARWYIFKTKNPNSGKF